MRFKTSNLSLYAFLAFLCGPHIAEAQAPLGVRAMGMAGAFVGVADDASAVYWNPAGLATGAIASFVISVGEEETAPQDGQDAVSERLTGRMVALSLPPVGLAYYRIGGYGSVATSAVTGPQSREEVRRSVQALTTSTVGVSLLQSLSDYIVVAATPKVVRAGGDTVFDVDAAVMFAAERLRAGLVARNLTTPTFVTPLAEDGGARQDGEIELWREVRAGIAWGSGWPGYSRVSVSVDADLASRLTPFGDRRDVAAGVETWWRNRTVALRGGARRSTIGEARGAVTGGASYALRPGIFVEGHVAAGDRHERGWSVGVRAGF